jgi:cytochrome c553
MKHRRRATFLRWAVVAAVVLLSACDRDSVGPPAPTGPTSVGAASSASAPAATASAPGSAAPPLVPAEVPAVAVAPGEDVSAGRQLATQGAPGVAACVGCHGANGEGNAQSGFPRLAALGRPYLEHQLNSFADGSRANPVMAPIATAMSTAQRSASAAFYAGLGNDAASARSAAAGGAEPVLAGRGDERRGIQACANCHGPQGIGDAAANPYLAGQHAQYLSSALAAWKDGTRRNDPSGQMPAIAKALADADTRTLVAYFASLPAPRNAQAVAVATAASGARPAVQSGPVAATQPLEGSGTEQGSALTGGSQGGGGAATNPAQSGAR